MQTSLTPPTGRFPYVAADPSDNIRVRAALAQTLELFEPVVRAIVRMHGHGLDHDDATQQVLLSLLTIALPSYDKARGEVKPYLIACIYRRVKELRRSHGREVRRHKRFLAGQPIAQEPTLTIMDARLDQLAAAIVTEPERFLNESQARVVRATHEYPNATKREIAELLGISATSLSRALRKARRTVASIAMEELVS